MMVETELKFQVPDAARAALQRAVATPAAQTLRLRARYFDTADRRLAAAGVALRLRQEGRHWVQTLKRGGASLSQRLEHEVRLPAGPASLDLHRHDGTPAGTALREALGDDPAPLQLVFETDVRRTRRVLRTGGARIELALDIGTVRAAGRQLPLWELEFELLAGPVQALFDLAGRWVQRHRLWLDVRTKAERGTLLAQGLAVRPPAGFRPPPLQPGLPVDAALRAMTAAALAQVLPNAAAVAGGVGGAEHLHQLRVGLRRLRSVLRVFAPEGGEGSEGSEGDAGDLARWTEALAPVFRRLGGARDRDVLNGTVLPALRAAGGPNLALPDTGAGPDAGAALREPATVGLLLELLAYADGHGDAPPAADAGDFESLARGRLRRLHRRLKAEAARFAELDEAQQHRLRRQIKRLRYGVDATQSLWQAKATRAYLEGLQPLQDALGLCNDLHLAWATLPMPDDAAGGFTRGWLTARRSQAAEAAAAALQRWPARPRAWRGR